MRHAHWSLTYAAALAAALAAAAPAAAARDGTSPVRAALIELAPRGDAAALAGVVELTNDGFEDRTVTLAPTRSARSALRVEPSTVTIGPRGVVSVRLLGALSDPGKHLLRLSVASRTLDGAEGPGDDLTVALSATRRADGGLDYTLSDYLSLFVHEGRYALEGIGKVYDTERGIPSRTTVPTPSFYRPLSLTETPSEPQTAQSKSVQGNFRFRDSEGKLRNGYAWIAKVYWQNGDKWTFANDAYVQGDSSFKVTTQIADGKKLRLTFTPANQYFAPEDPEGNAYQWTSPPYAANGAVVDVGNHWVNTESGQVAGLGELHLDAVDLWNKLDVWANIDPRRDAPLRLVFPNSGGCGNCANPNGKVWITTSRATNHRTIYHELGHQLMYEFWNDELPPDSGGDHTWPDCATAGLALSEGFAHFVSWWANVDRDVATSSFPGGWNGETLPNSVCKDQSLNELRVAATFWDLHDKPKDADDKLWFTTMAGTLQVFLGAGMQEDISLFRPLYRDAVQANLQSTVDKIFAQNFTTGAP